jgi:hypothetical protein
VELGLGVGCRCQMMTRMDRLIATALRIRKHTYFGQEL